MVKGTPGMQRGESVFSTKNPPKMFLDDDVAAELTDELFTLLKWEGKPSFWYKAAQTSISYVVWSLSTAFKILGAGWQAIVSFLKHIGQY